MATRKMPRAYDDVHALLHTVRCIQQHETKLCTLVQAIRTEGKVSASVRKELLSMLDDMPGAEYAVELESVRESLANASLR